MVYTRSSIWCFTVMVHMIWFNRYGPYDMGLSHYYHYSHCDIQFVFIWNRLFVKNQFLVFFCYTLSWVGSSEINWVFSWWYYYWLRVAWSTFNVKSLQDQKASLNIIQRSKRLFAMILYLNNHSLDTIKTVFWSLDLT